MSSRPKRPSLRGVWIGLCLSLGVAGYAWGPKYLLYGRFTLPGWEEMIGPGLPVAEAMRTYRAEHGLWPQYLEDLIPEHLSALPVDSETCRWEYDWSHWRVHLDGRFPQHPRTAVSYHASPDEKPAWYWSETGEGLDPYGRLDLQRPETHPAGIDEAALVPRKLEELRRRIEREPTRHVHRRGLVSYLVNAERLAEAHEVCLEYEVALPAEWWPRVVLALIDARREECSCGEERLLRWVEEHEAFMPGYYLSLYHRANGDFAAALEALRRAVEYPFLTGEEEEKVDCYYIYDVACFAHRHGAHQLVLAIGEQWEGLREESSDEGSWLAVRAASRLALGEPKRAAADLALLRDQKEGRALWADDVDELRRAVESEDEGFRYDPGEPRFECAELLIDYR